MRFQYLRDPLFLLACGCYCINRWYLKPRVDSEFLHSWFNDLLLIPCAIPVVLWLFRLLRLRDEDSPPFAHEVVWILIAWSLLFEWIGPEFSSHATADFRDVAMYWIGGIASWLFWHRRAADFAAA